MNSEVLDKANELSKRIEELEGFMFWCSGKEEGFRRYPAAIVAVKRKWYGAVESKNILCRIGYKIGLLKR